MHYDGITYRPPVEANSLLLQVTVGCAHNECTYCGMYKDVSFRIEKMEQIEEDLKEARGLYMRVERMFLVNGDAFVLKAEYLKAIAIKIKKYFPECKTIAMYASIQNIKSKTDEELKELSVLGIKDLYVGIESGHEEVVTRINKGHTVKEAIGQLKRLNESGINHSALLMLGVAGKGHGLENARATADFLNVTKPKMVWVGTLGIFKGTKLSEKVKSGEFVGAYEIENLLEEITLIENIELDNVPFYGVHPTNAISVSGTLPRDKEKMIKYIKDGIRNFGVEALSKTFRRATL